MHYDAVGKQGGKKISQQHQTPSKQQMWKYCDPWTPPDKAEARKTPMYLIVVLVKKKIPTPILSL